MALGASVRQVDNATDLDAANLNTLDDGGNVYHSPNGGLNFRITAATLRLRDRRFDFAEVVADQAATASVTTYVFVDQAGALATNVTGFPADAPHIPLAEVASSGSAITGITDRRTRLELPGGTDWRAWRAGRFYAQRREIPGGTITLTADTLYGIPFAVHSWAAIDRIAVEVTTLDGGSAIRLGLYAESLTVRGEPGVLLEDLGTVSSGTTGIKSLTISPTRNLAPGLYFIAVISSSAVTALRAYTAADSADLGWPGGTSDLLAGSVDAMWRGAGGANDEAASFPDPFPATPTADLGFGAAMPAVILRGA
jgi:hypothetical protein